MATNASTAVLGERRAGRSRTESPFLPGLAIFGLRCGDAAAIALAGALAWWLHPVRETVGPHPVAAIALACWFAGWLARAAGRVRSALRIRSARRAAAPARCVGVHDGGADAGRVTAAAVR